MSFFSPALYRDINGKSRAFGEDDPSGYALHAACANLRCCTCVCRFQIAPLMTGKHIIGLCHKFEQHYYTGTKGIPPKIGELECSAYIQGICRSIHSSIMSQIICSFSGFEAERGFRPVVPTDLSI